MDQELLEAAQAQIEVMKEVYKSCDEEYYQLLAGHVKKMYDAYIAVEFSPGTAIDLVRASLIGSKAG